ncbi:FAD-binding domain-containing protein [Dipodascopsis tothii]|uniref:FAD-binding domain-containing protein n=1 Tax=Dipodascopsis tothii TaxID=44089 RepID=UPI0034CF139C
MITLHGLHVHAFRRLRMSNESQNGLNMDDAGRDWSRNFYWTYNIIIAGIFLCIAGGHFYRIRYLTAVHPDPEKDPLLPNTTKSSDLSSRRVGLRKRVLRRLQAVAVYQPPGRYLESNGKSIVVSIYLGLNAFYIFIHEGSNSKQVFANRCGLMSIANLPLLFLLGSKTGLLVAWSGWSHDGYLILHRHVGRVVCITALLHVGFYCSVIPLTVRLQLNNEAVVGLIATIAFSVLLTTSLAPLRTKLYELFLWTHIWFLVIPLPFLYFHWTRCKPYVILCAIVFLSDRLNRIKSSYTLIASSRKLPGKTVKLSLQLNSSIRDIHWRTGQFVYISIAQIAMLQRHPFTIASLPAANTLDLIIRAREGFSRRLFEDNDENHSVQVSGPYGSPPSFRSATKVIFLSGGTGISYAFPEAIALAQKSNQYSNGKAIEFMWIIPHEEYRNWVDLDSEKYGVDFKVWITSRDGRPDVKSYVTRNVTDSVSAANGDKDVKVVVTACGPAEMVRVARNACASLLWDGYNVEFHSEAFGW